MARPEKVFAFTGHRLKEMGPEHGRRAVQTRIWLSNHIKRIIRKYESVTFITGGAVGVDMWAFQLVDECRRILPPSDKIRVNNVLILPCIKHYATWPPKEQEKMINYINNVATHVYYSDPNEYKGGWQMQNRNIAMVDKADGLIAVWNNGDSGGTYNCVTYAMEKGVPILGFNPENLKQFRIV